MPIRRRLCQEVRSSSHRVTHNGLWITDDALQDAFNRFLRYSHGAKRYGSNVPGPLEAQRRLAKRRMMALAGAGAAPPVDPAALFGIQGPQIGKMVWQAPDQGKLRDKPKTTDDSWLARLGLKPPSTRAPTSRDEIEITEPLSSLEHRIGTASIDGMAVIAKQLRTVGRPEYMRICKTAFDILLKRPDTTQKHLLEFLMNPHLNHPEARHLTNLIANPALYTKNKFDLNADQLVESCLKLGLICEEEIPELIEAASKRYPASKYRDLVKFSKELFRANALVHAIWRGIRSCRTRPVPSSIAALILEKMPNRRTFSAFRLELYQHLYPIAEDGGMTHDVEHYLVSWVLQIIANTNTTSMKPTVLVDILENLHPKCVDTNVIVRATKILLKKVLPAKLERATDGNGWAAPLSLWLVCLRRSLPYRIWNPAIKVVASHNVSPLDISAAFSHLGPYYVCKALLQYWIPKLAEPPDFLGLKTSSLVYEDDCGSHATERKGSSEAWAGVFDEFQFLCHERDHNSRLDTEPFTFLFIALYRRNRMSLAIQETVLALCSRIYDAEAINHFIDHCRQAGVYFHPAPVAELIARYLHQHPRIALSLYKSRNVHLNRVPDLPVVLINDGVQGLDIMKILHDYAPQHQIPVSQRHEGWNSLTDKKIALVHDCAYAFSKRMDDQPRTTFRNTYLCYRYLSTRQAPMGPLLSRALVQAGITNYLRAGLHVSLQQVRWILGIVEKIEGSEVAQELDVLVWRWMTRVFANRRRVSKSRKPSQQHRARLGRAKNGLLRRRSNIAWKVDNALLPRRIRWYLETGEITHSHVDAVMHKHLRTKIRKTFLRYRPSATANIRRVM